MENNDDEVGTIRIANEVVSIIAGLAATEVEGVAGMSGGLAGGIADMLGKKNLSKGVKVEVGEKEAAVDLYVIMEYGSKIPDVAWQIQDNVKQAIEDMTGLTVVEVNIHVQGVNFDEEEEEEEEEQVEIEEEVNESRVR
ncbi:Asp23/Gls24 family envelope stress response protein [Fuchsiella alkaliacetigena]|uniref:Asp23/Gls24 family envelope stress response protein n=1 Tax=Fuchsiella alkaliacetigena TaxID=957042 RepID=UPI00200B7F29|nr:Asp23/Gls24 family envelope stress response protein [Fuchsiella alkaliacetigena]MCK8825450.1 Asp23/Gls24 family envelope stress response protein [Fuchsiella alkaliacetigena]